MSGIATLNVNDEKPKLQKSSNASAQDWESWTHLKISAFHGKKLTKKNFKPYHPKVVGKTFFLHEIDDLSLTPEEKLFITMRVFKKLFGSVVSSDTSKGRKLNTKLTFLREKGRQHFTNGKPIKELIAFPESYWQAYRDLLEAKHHGNRATDNNSPKRARSDLVTDKQSQVDNKTELEHSSTGVQTRKRKFAK